MISSKQKKAQTIIEKKKKTQSDTKNIKWKLYCDHFQQSDC